MGPMNPLVVEQVTKTFRTGHGDVVALDRISLAVERGDFLAIMGPSGSGKSTLLHLMAGLTAPDSGRVVVNGQDLGRMSDRTLTRFRRSHIGLVFQTFNLIPTLTAQENVALPLRLGALRPNGTVATARRALERLNLLHRADHRPDALSGGEQQRVAIARALIADPAVVLADEPTGNLDSANSRTICQLLRQLNESEQATIIMVTHEPSVAIYAKQVLLLRDGRIHDIFDTTSLDAVHLAERYQASIQ
jgi:putative ABC transport system ATP-binding protein